MMNRLLGKGAQILFVILLALYAAYLIKSIAADPVNLQWDFIVYYHAADTYSRGLNPYIASDVEKISGKSIALPYIYLPITLWFFKPFTLLNYENAAYLWLALKIILTMGLVLIWKRYFLAESWSPFFYLILLFAYDSALFWDIKSGNMSLLEQGILWTAFLALVKERPALFALLIVCVSFFKITTLSFLVLLPLSRYDRKWWYFGGALAFFGIVVGADYLAHPDLIPAFLARMGEVAEQDARYNYGVLIFFRNVFDLVLRGRTVAAAGLLPVLAYGVTAGVVLFLTGRAVYRWNPSGQGRDYKLIIFLFCLAYALAFPRLKCYSLVLLIVPSYYIIQAHPGRWMSPALLLLLLMPVSTPLPDTEWVQTVSAYYPLILAFICWSFCLSYFNERSADKSPKDTPVP